MVSDARSNRRARRPIQDFARHYFFIGHRNANTCFLANVDVGDTAILRQVGDPVRFAAKPALAT
jgi:hypothetical protein